MSGLFQMLKCSQVHNGIKDLVKGGSTKMQKINCKYLVRANTEQVDQHLVTLSL